MIDFGSGVALHIPDTRPTDPIQALAWDMLRLEHHVMLAAIDDCPEAGAVRIVAQMNFDDEAIKATCRKRLLELAGCVQPAPQLSLFRTALPIGGH